MSLVRMYIQIHKYIYMYTHTYLHTYTYIKNKYIQIYTTYINTYIHITEVLELKKAQWTASDGAKVLHTSLPDAFCCFEEDGEANVVLGHDTVDHFVETVGSFNRQLIELHQMVLDCPESEYSGNKRYLHSLLVHKNNEHHLYILTLCLRHTGQLHTVCSCLLNSSNL